MKHLKYSLPAVGQTALVLFLLLITACLKEDLNPAEGIPTDYIALLDVRKIYRNEEVVLNTTNMTGATKITGVVISDITAGNIPKGIVVIQQATRGELRGIELNLGAGVDVPYKMGDSISVSVQDLKMNRNQGALQIMVEDVGRITKVADNRSTDVTELSLATLNANLSKFESTLIKIPNVDNTSAAVTLSGDVSVKEPSGATGRVHTEPAATFANRAVAVNASFTGIVRLNNMVSENLAAQLWLINEASISDESGALYGGFPENFEGGDAAITAAGYSTKTGALSTGSYTLTNTGLNKEANDLAVSGVYALRMNQNSASDSWCTMNYDLPNGATKVTVWAGSYGAAADLGSTWRLEYSRNAGGSWLQIGEDILTTSKVKKLYTFLMDIKGPVRFRFGKKGIGSSSVSNQNGRLSMDDFSIYRNSAGAPVVIPEYKGVMGWQFSTAAGNEATASATSVDVGLNVGILSRGAGLVAGGLVRSFASTSLGPIVTSTKELAIAQNSYYQVSFSVKPGYKFSLSAIDAILRRTAAGAKYFQWYYSLDGLNFKETTWTGEVLFEDTNTNGIPIAPYYVYETPELQNIPSGKTVTLRMYCWGFTNASTGNFSIGRTPASTLTNALSLGGTVTPQ
ncbi:DUF5689 domain-containing protein [Pedobacter sp. MC2016-14]|uniref:DUF5689 domain-containing protein n=1 Tax=Pedobacter sp. MC2016-14 TaxID=2897327 RepID=UPI001E363FF3|nr:DUF5689 domain-containing protein [Pedobacter sp. MC2016-14]MCD0488188.1 DUF5689 domain-containing protein [Pedobacter sp. MC2016-14]